MVVCGIRFSYDTSLSVGSRVVSLVLVDEDDNITARIVSNGMLRSDAPASIKLVTLSFLAGNNAGLNAPGGDDYPFKLNADNFRFLQNDDTLSAPVDEALSFTASGVAPANVLGEQLALSDYLQARYSTAPTAYNIADTVQAFDIRIQNKAARTDNVLDGPATFAAWLALNGFTSGGINTDTDLDGSIDLIEYFFNQSTNDGADNGNLPVVTSASGEKFLVFTTNNTVAGVSGILQNSNDLGIADTWETAVEGVDYEVVSNVVNGAETTTTVRLLGTAPNSFWRHSISSN